MLKIPDMNPDIIFSKWVLRSPFLGVDAVALKLRGQEFKEVATCHLVVTGTVTEEALLSLSCSGSVEPSGGDASIWLLLNLFRFLGHI